MDFYPFCQEEELKCSSPGFYFVVMNVINRNKSIMEPYNDMIEEALSNLHSEILNSDPFGRRENDDVQEELANGNNLLDDFENVLDETIFSDEISSLSNYATPTLTRDPELDTMIKSLNDKKHALFNTAHSWRMQYIKSLSPPLKS